MEVLLKNLQSIEELALTFPDKGIVCLSGGNSNGKSIFVKTLNTIVTGKWEDYDERRPLIRDLCDEGSLTMRYDGKILAVRLNDDRDHCCMGLYRADGSKIVRTFREGGMDKLLNEFGFRVYGNGKICLQIYETFGLMPFVNTSSTTDYEMVNSAVSDSVGEAFLTNFKDITYKEAKDKLKVLDERVDELSSMRASLMIYDWKNYEELTVKIASILKDVKYLNAISPCKIKLPPKVSILDVYFDVPCKIKFVKAIPVLSIPKSVNSNIHEINEILNGKCPTCGSLLINDECKIEVIVNARV